MGSVSSLISGHSLHSKHCRASEYKLKKAAQSKKTGRNLDGLLRYGFSQDSTNNNSKAIFQSGKSEDFFYIKVSHKPRASHHRNTTTEDQPEELSVMETGNCTPPKLVPMSGKLEKGIEKGLVRPTAFKPVIPRSSTYTDSHSNLNQLAGKRLSPSDRAKEQLELKPDVNSGTLSDSGRNSMSSLPTHSTSGSSQMDNLSTSTGLLIRCGGSAHNVSLPQQLSTVPSGAGGGSFKATAFRDCMMAKLSRDGISPEHQNPLSESAGGCVRSPISMDESLIQQLEQRLLERETELQELQVSFEEKEADTCQLFEEKQKYCAEEMEGLKQRCSTKLRQVSQRALRAQQVFQLQVFQLQQEKKKLQDDLTQLSQEKDLMEVKLRSYETEQTQLVPTLEETQWEVCQKSGEISLLKQQLKDSQADVSHKLNEIVSLKATLKETKSMIEALEKKTKEQEEAVHARTVEVEVCENELQRKKNEADLLREKVGQLETDIRAMKQDLALAKEQQQNSREMAKGSQSEAKGQADGGPDEDTEALQTEVNRLKGELREEKQRREKMASSFQLERQTWNKEKDKVIKYQKQLQYNYLQMHRKNKDLEKILRELTTELESRTELDIDVQSADIHYEDIIATEI